MNNSSIRSESVAAAATYSTKSRILRFLNLMGLYFGYAIFALALGLSWAGSNQFLYNFRFYEEFDYLYVPPSVGLHKKEGSRLSGIFYLAQNARLNIPTSSHRNSSSQATSSKISSMNNMNQYVIDVNNVLIDKVKSQHVFSPSFVAVIYSTISLIAFAICFGMCYIISTPFLWNKIYSKKSNDESSSTKSVFENKINHNKDLLNPGQFTNHEPKIAMFSEIFKSTLSSMFGMAMTRSTMRNNSANALFNANPEGTAVVVDPINDQDIAHNNDNNNGNSKTNFMTYKIYKIIGKKRGIGKLFIYCVLWSFSIYFYCLTAFSLSPSEFSAIYASNISFTYTLLWVLLHEKFLAHKILAMVSFLTSIILFTHYRGEFLNYLGNVLLCVASSFLYSLFKVSLKRALNHNIHGSHRGSSYRSFPQSQSQTHNSSFFGGKHVQEDNKSKLHSFPNGNLTRERERNEIITPLNVYDAKNHLKVPETEIYPKSILSTDRKNSRTLSLLSNMLSPVLTPTTSSIKSSSGYISSNLDINKSKSVTPRQSPIENLAPTSLPLNYNKCIKWGIRTPTCFTLLTRTLFYLILILCTLLLLWPLAIILQLTKTEIIHWKGSPWTLILIAGSLHAAYTLLYELGPIVIRENDHVVTLGIWLGVIFNTVADIYFQRLLLNRMMQIAFSFNFLGFLLLMIPKKWHKYTGKVIKVKRISAVTINSSVTGVGSGFINSPHQPFNPTHKAQQYKSGIFKT